MTAQLENIINTRSSDLINSIYTFFCFVELVNNVLNDKHFDTYLFCDK